MKKKEKYFIGGLLLVSLIFCAIVYLVPHGQYGSIEITVDGKVLESIPLQRSVHFHQ
ncbi:MAG: hypothetical protein ACLT0W_05770 [Clostridium sp.]